MSKWVGQKMAQKIGYPLWMASKEVISKDGLQHVTFIPFMIIKKVT